MADFQDMHAIMVRPLPTGCRLTAIFDVSLLLLACLLTAKEVNLSLVTLDRS